MSYLCLSKCHPVTSSYAFTFTCLFCFEFRKFRSLHRTSNLLTSNHYFLIINQSTNENVPCRRCHCKLSSKCISCHQPLRVDHVWAHHWESPRSACRKAPWSSMRLPNRWQNCNHVPWLAVTSPCRSSEQLWVLGHPTSALLWSNLLIFGKGKERNRKLWN